MHAEPYTTSATAHARHAQNSKEKSRMLKNVKRPGPGWFKESHWKLKKRTLEPQTCRTPMPSSVSSAPERQILDQKLVVAPSESVGRVDFENVHIAKGQGLAGSKRAIGSLKKRILKPQKCRNLMSSRTPNEPSSKKLCSNE